jgi:hypothetical protein
MTRRLAVWLVIALATLGGCLSGGEPPPPASPSPTRSPIPTPSEFPTQTTPATSPSPTDEPTGGGGEDPLQDEVRTLRDGQIVFQVPRQMELEVASIVVARIARGASPITSGLDEGGGPVEEEPIQVSAEMKMVLTSIDQGVTITSLSEELQPVPETGFTTWRWSVVPQRSGNVRLSLRAVARVTSSDGGSVTQDIGVFDREIQVSVSFGNRLANFLANNWQWGAGTLLTVFGLGVGRGWFKRRKAADAAK